MESGRPLCSGPINPPWNNKRQVQTHIDRHETFPHFYISADCVFAQEERKLSLTAAAVAQLQHHQTIAYSSLPSSRLALSATL